MKKSGIMVILSSLLISCEYLDNGNAFPPGTYKGKLTIDAGLIDIAPVDVTMIFTGGRYSVTSNVWQSNTCNSGTYKFTAQGIEFTSDCAGPPDFLTETFQLKVFYRQIEMTQVSNYRTYTYKLILQ